MTRSPGIGFVGAAAATAVLTGTFTTSTFNSSGLTTYTFPAQSLGTADAGRTIVVVVGGRSSPVRALNSATINGVPATIVGQTTVANANHSSIIRALVPSGTTGDIVLTFNGAMARATIAVYAVYAVNGNLTVLDSDFLDTYAATPINVVPNGFVIAGSFSGATSTYTWTQITENVETDIGGNTYTAACIGTVSTGTITPTAVITNGGTATLVQISLAPV